ncbi:MAG: hypothetical protein A3G87_04510 [Omnitrophica bacterium RIFCSPLOWO2_12_FULL_50_11]|nr:MAG: hypothetical protein A3G87_04510 [Omnitrophica bacterium RIFCSPLOWO2_12_FULL_50_11]
MTAFFVLISFTLLETSKPASAMVVQEDLPSERLARSLIPREVIASLSVPEELGTVNDTYLPTGKGEEKLVIYVESAHANYDSESKTGKLIKFFQEELDLPLVLLEGGAGQLDSLFFKSFPHQKLKERTLSDYLRKGDLSGGEVASILNEDAPTEYYGIEDLKFYRENKRAFLKALERKDEILRKVDEIETRLLNSASEIFSARTKKFYESSSAFRRDEIDLLKYVKILHGLFRKYRKDKSTSFYSSYLQLHTLVKAASDEKRLGKSEMCIVARRMIEAFQEEILPKLPRSSQMEANELIQMYSTERLSSGLLTERLKSISEKQNLYLDTPKELGQAQEQAQTLSSIKGTKLFDELEALEADLRQSLPESDKEGALLEDFHHLGLLRNFAKLELSRKEWESMHDRTPSEMLTSFTVNPTQQRRSSLRGGPNGRRSNLRSEIASSLSGLRPRNDETLDSAFSSHYEFYHLAEERDAILLENALARMDERKTNFALIAAGGFHTAGITQRLREKKIPYVLISPKISQLDSRENYLDLMRGKRSFMNEFSGNLWDALAQDYAAKLARALNPFERARILKRWRDQIIQNAFAEGRITEASEYTRYVDAIAKTLAKKTSSTGDSLSDTELRKQIEEEVDSFLFPYFKKIESLITDKLNFFHEGLKGLWQTSDLTPESVGDLFTRMNHLSQNHLAVDLVLTSRGIRGGDDPEAFKAAARDVSQELFPHQDQEFHQAVAEEVVKQRGTPTSDERKRLRRRNSLSSLPQSPDEATPKLRRLQRIVSHPSSSSSIIRSEIRQAADVVASRTGPELIGGTSRRDFLRAVSAGMVAIATVPFEAWAQTQSPFVRTGVQEVTTRDGWWKIQGAADTGLDQSMIQIGSKHFSEVQLFFLNPRSGQHEQIISVQGNGFVRAVAYDGVGKPITWGTSFITPGYWTGDRYYHNSLITKADFAYDASKRMLMLKGNLVDQGENFVARDFTLVFGAPTREGITPIEVSFTLKALRDFEIDRERQLRHEGFKIMQFSSMNIGDVYDADTAVYWDSEANEITASLAKRNAFVFDDPKPVGSEGVLVLANARLRPERIRSNTAFQLLQAHRGGKRVVLTPQGYVNISDDPNDDNVNVWINDDTVQRFTSQETIGAYRYRLFVTPPGKPSRPKKRLPQPSRSEVRMDRRDFLKTAGIGLGLTASAVWGLDAAAEAIGPYVQEQPAEEPTKAMKDAEAKKVMAKWDYDHEGYRSKVEEGLKARGDEKRLAYFREMIKNFEAILSDDKAVRDKAGVFLIHRFVHPDEEVRRMHNELILWAFLSFDGETGTKILRALSKDSGADRSGYDVTTSYHPDHLNELEFVKEGGHVTVTDARTAVIDMIKNREKNGFRGTLAREFLTPVFRSRRYELERRHKQVHVGIDGFMAWTRRLVLANVASKDVPIGMEISRGALTALQHGMDFMRPHPCLNLVMLRPDGSLTVDLSKPENADVFKAGYEEAYYGSLGKRLWSDGFWTAQALLFMGAFYRPLDINHPYLYDLSDPLINLLDEMRTHIERIIANEVIPNLDANSPTKWVTIRTTANTLDAVAIARGMALRGDRFGDSITRMESISGEELPRVFNTALFNLLPQLTAGTLKLNHEQMTQILNFAAEYVDDSPVSRRSMAQFLGSDQTNFIRIFFEQAVLNVKNAQSPLDEQRYARSQRRIMKSVLALETEGESVQVRLNTASFVGLFKSDHWRDIEIVMFDTFQALVEQIHNERALPKDERTTMLDWDQITKMFTALYGDAATDLEKRQTLLPYFRDLDKRIDGKDVAEVDQYENLVNQVGALVHQEVHAMTARDAVANQAALSEYFFFDRAAIRHMLRTSRRLASSPVTSYVKTVELLAYSSDDVDLARAYAANLVGALVLRDLKDSDGNALLTQGEIAEIDRVLKGFNQKAATEDAWKDVPGLIERKAKEWKDTLSTRQRSEIREQEKKLLRNRPRRFQFTLRQLMLVIAGLGIAFSLMKWGIDKYQRDQRNRFFQRAIEKVVVDLRVVAQLDLSRRDPAGSADRAKVIPRSEMLGADENVKREWFDLSLEQLGQFEARMIDEIREFYGDSDTISLEQFKKLARLTGFHVEEETVRNVSLQFRGLVEKKLYGQALLTWFWYFLGGVGAHAFFTFDKKDGKIKKVSVLESVNLVSLFLIVGLPFVISLMVISSLDFSQIWQAIIGFISFVFAALSGLYVLLSVYFKFKGEAGHEWLHVYQSGLLDRMVRDLKLPWNPAQMMGLYSPWIDEKSLVDSGVKPSRQPPTKEELIKVTQQYIEFFRDELVTWDEEKPTSGDSHPGDIRGRSEARDYFTLARKIKSLGDRTEMPWKGLSSSRSLSPEIMASTFPAKAHSSTALSLRSRHAWSVMLGLTILADWWIKETRSEILRFGTRAWSFGFENAVMSSSNRGAEMTNLNSPWAIFNRIDRGNPWGVKSALTNTFVSTTISFIDFLPGLLDDFLDVTLAQAGSLTALVNLAKEHFPSGRKGFGLQSTDELDLVFFRQLVYQFFNLVHIDLQSRHELQLLSQGHRILSARGRQQLNEGSQSFPTPHPEARTAEGSRKILSAKQSGGPDTFSGGRFAQDEPSGLLKKNSPMAQLNRAKGRGSVTMTDSVPAFRSEARRKKKGLTKTERRAQKRIERAEREATEAKRGVRRRILVMTTGIVGGAAFTAWGGWSIWDHFIRDKQPWEDFEIDPNASAQEQFQVSKQFTLNTIQWMIDEGFPYPQILKRLMTAVREKGVIAPPQSGFVFGKKYNASDGLLEFIINQEKIYPLLELLQHTNSKDIFIETVVGKVVREAWGLYMLELGGEIVTKLFDTADTMESLENFPRTEKGAAQFLRRDREKIHEIAARGILVELYESIREREVLEWAALQNLYSFERASADLRKAEAHVRFDAFDRALYPHERGKRILSASRDLTGMLQSELSVFLPRGLRPAYGGRSDQAQPGFILFAMSEIDRHRESGEAKGVGIGPEVEDFVKRESMAGDRESARMGYFPKAELFASSASVILRYVRTYLRELESPLPENWRIAPAYDPGNRSEVRSSWVSGKRAEIERAIEKYLPRHLIDRTTEERQQIIVGWKRMIRPGSFYEALKKIVFLYYGRMVLAYLLLGVVIPSVVDWLLPPNLSYLAAVSFISSLVFLMVYPTWKAYKAIPKGSVGARFLSGTRFFPLPVLFVSKDYLAEIAVAIMLRVLSPYRIDERDDYEEVFASALYWLIQVEMSPSFHGELERVFNLPDEVNVGVTPVEGPFITGLLLSTAAPTSEMFQTIEEFSDVLGGAAYDQGRTAEIVEAAPVFIGGGKRVWSSIRMWTQGGVLAGNAYGNARQIVDSPQKAFELAHSFLYYLKSDLNQGREPNIPSVLERLRTLSRSETRAEKKGKGLLSRRNFIIAATVMSAGAVIMGDRLLRPRDERMERIERSRKRRARNPPVPIDKPWHAIEITSGDLVTIDHVKQAVYVTVDWLIARGYPYPDILDHYASYVESALPMERKKGYSFALYGDEVAFNVQDVGQMIVDLKQLESLALFMENLGLSVIREAWELEMMLHQDERSINVAEPMKALESVRRSMPPHEVHLQDHAYTSFLMKNKQVILDHLELSVSAETYGSLREDEGRQWAERLNIYSSSQARKDLGLGLRQQKLFLGPFSVVAQNRRWTTQLINDHGDPISLASTALSALTIEALKEKKEILTKGYPVTSLAYLHAAYLHSHLYPDIGRRMGIRAAPLQEELAPYFIDFLSYAKHLWLSLEPLVRDFESTLPQQNRILPEKARFDGGAVEKILWRTTDLFHALVLNQRRSEARAGQTVAEYVYRNVQDREAHVIYGTHGYEVVKELFNTNVKPLLHADPQNWLFLVEGMAVINYPEIVEAVTTAHDLNIPVVNPVLDYANRPVVDRYLANRPNENLLSVYGPLLVAVTDLGKPVDRALKDTAIISGLPIQGLQAFLQFARAMDVNPRAYQAMADRIAHLDRELSPISNELSIQILRWYLRQYPEKKKIFILIGTGHYPMLDMDAVQAANRLTDQEIEAILRDRAEIQARRTRSEARKNLGRRRRVEGGRTRLLGPKEGFVQAGSTNHTGREPTRIFPVSDINRNEATDSLHRSRPLLMRSNLPLQTEAMFLERSDKTALTEGQTTQGAEWKDAVGRSAPGKFGHFAPADATSDALRQGGIPGNNQAGRGKELGAEKGLERFEGLGFQGSSSGIPPFSGALQEWSSLERPSPVQDNGRYSDPPPAGRNIEEQSGMFYASQLPINENLSSPPFTVKPAPRRSEARAVPPPGGLESDPEAVQNALRNSIRPFLTNILRSWQIQGNINNDTLDKIIKNPDTVVSALKSALHDVPKRKLRLLDVIDHENRLIQGVKRQLRIAHENLMGMEREGIQLAKPGQPAPTLTVSLEDIRGWREKIEKQYNEFRGRQIRQAERSGIHPRYVDGLFELAALFQRVVRKIVSMSLQSRLTPALEYEALGWFHFVAHLSYTSFHELMAKLTRKGIASGDQQAIMTEFINRVRGPEFPTHIKSHLSQGALLTAKLVTQGAIEDLIDIYVTKTIDMETSETRTWHMPPQTDQLLTYYRFRLSFLRDWFFTLINLRMQASFAHKGNPHAFPAALEQFERANFPRVFERSEVRHSDAALEGALNLDTLIGTRELNGQEIGRLAEEIQQLQSIGVPVDEIFDQNRLTAIRHSEIAQLYPKLLERTATRLMDLSEQVNSREITAADVRQVVDERLLEGFHKMGVPIATVDRLPFASLFQSGVDKSAPRLVEILSRARPHTPQGAALETDLVPISLPSERAQQVAQAIFSGLENLHDAHTLHIDFSTFGLNPELPEDEPLVTDFLEAQIRLLDAFKNLQIEVVGVESAQMDDLLDLYYPLRNEKVRTRADNSDLDRRMRIKPRYLTPNPSVVVTGHGSQIPDMTTIFDPTRSHRGTQTVRFRGSGSDAIQPGSIVLLGAALITEKTVEALEQMGERHFILGSDLAFAREAAFALDLLLRQAETRKVLQRAA